MSGINTFRHLHGRLKKYTYHGEKAERWGESCDRVDLEIVSRSLGRVLGVWDSVEERAGSDHIPLSIVLDVVKLGDKCAAPSQPIWIFDRDFLARLTMEFRSKPFVFALFNLFEQTSL